MQANFQKERVVRQTCCVELIFKFGRFLGCCVRSTRVGDAENTGKCLDGNKSLRITKIKFETLEGSVQKENSG